MIVYFLRHGNAGERRANPVQDEKRPLDKEGIEQCRYMGRLLSSLDAHVDLILSSPLKRSTQSAAMVANEIAYEQKIEMTPALRPGASFEAFRDLLYKVGGLEAVMVVGHNPEPEPVSLAAGDRRAERERDGDEKGQRGAGGGGSQAQRAELAGDPAAD